MALVRGTNYGFCASAPTADPAETYGVAMDGQSRALKDVAPTGATAVTEIGFWIPSEGSTPANQNFEVAIYSHDGTNDRPLNIVGSDIVNALGTSEDVWVRVTGLNIPIVAGTTYWIAWQIDAQSGTIFSDYKVETGATVVGPSSQTALADPFASPMTLQDYAFATYAVYSTGGSQSIVPHLNSYRRRRM